MFMNARLSRFAFPAALALTASAALAVEAPPPVFIRGATLITVSGETYTGSILLKDGKIAALGRDIAAPVGVEIMDGAGKFVTPGLVEAHSHMGVYSFPGGQALDDGNEATSPVTPEVRAMDSFNVHDPAIRRAWRGGVTAAQVIPGSANCIGGQGVVVKYKFGVPVERMFVPGAMRPVKMAMGENPKRVYGSRDERPSTRMGSAAVMRQAFLEAQDYMKKWEQFRAGKWETHAPPPAHDLRLEALAAILRGELAPNVHGYTVGDLMTLFRIADEFGFKVRATHHSLEAYKIPEEYVRRGVYCVIFADLWGFKQESYLATQDAPAILHRAGVRVILHTDHPVIEQRYLIHEAAKAVRYGLPEDAAFRAVMLYPAELAGIAGRCGSLEAGKDADVVLWDGHPFEISTKALMTFIDGERVFDRARDGE
jgi:imidazolonepropionase-like amidohydrolase